MVRSAATTTRGGALAHPVDYKASEFGGYARDADVFLAVPSGRCIAHAKDRECREARIEVRPELAFRHTFPDDLLEDALDPARPAADPSTAFARQVLPLILENPDKIAAIEERRQMRIDEQREAFVRAVRSRANGLCGVEKSLDTFQADELQRRLF